jgi:hypothetical protein
MHYILPTGCLSKNFDAQKKNRFTFNLSIHFSPSLGPALIVNNGIFLATALVDFGNDIEHTHTNNVGVKKRFCGRLRRPRLLFEDRLSKIVLFQFVFV